MENKKKEIQKEIGKVSISERGFGFVRLQNKKDVYLSKTQAQRAFDGETVEVKIIKKNGKKEGFITRFIKRKDLFLGKVEKKNNDYFVRLTPYQKIKINNYAQESGNIIKFKITTFQTEKEIAQADFIEIMGLENTPKIENKLAIFNHSLPHIFSQEILNKVRKVNKNISKKDRFDLTDLNFVTIDGRDSRDFDDAVYCEKADFGWFLYVAIADVAHYVEKGSALDLEAFKRGNSVYFPNEVIPMLPEELSNDLCSLKPNVDRYSVVLKMDVTNTGNIQSFKFMNAVINSKARLVYDDVSDFLENNNQLIPNKYPNVVRNLKELNKVYEILKKNKENRGALEFEKRENLIIFDNKNEKIEEVKFYERRVSNKIIEEMMLCANICAAKMFQKLKLDCIYRVHEPPKEEAIASLRDSLQSVNVKIKEEAGIKTKQLKKIMDLNKNRNDSFFINQLILKTLKRAKYQVENKGHFGLAYKEYTHFTSPIRRYSDLVVHRAIKAIILSNEGSKYVSRKVLGVGKINDYYDYVKKELEEISYHISETERVADRASDDVFDALACHFISEKKEKDYSGFISFMTKTSMSIEFDDFVIEGILPYSSVNDYLVYDEKKGIVKGKKSKNKYRLGDRITFNIENVDKEKNKIYLKLKS